MPEHEDGDKYDVLEKIGQGSFGIIRKVRLRSTGQVLCRKEISYSRMSPKEKEQLYSELKILESLRHPSIVQYYHRQHIKSCNDLHLYMEYCGNGDLGGYIKKLKNKGQCADEEFVWTVFAQLVGALYRCHYGEDPPASGQEGLVKKGKTFQTKEGYRVVLHRDLKPENVFLSQNNAVKLGDFGLSKIIAAHDFASTYVGTPFYMSPEICAAERYSHHSDVWSLGCIMYELASLCVPFDARSHVELVMKIKAGRIKPLPSTYSQELWEVISWCLKVNPQSRPDMAQLLNVAQIKMARAKLEQVNALDIAQRETTRVAVERDGLMSKLQSTQKQMQELQGEVQKLREAGKKIEMEWHARATLAIDQRVSEAVEKMRQDFDGEVEQKVQEKLDLHYASLPATRGADQTKDTAIHVRSNTPPPGKTASFATTATTATTNGSSVAGDDSIDTDLSSLSIMGHKLGDNESPLAQRTKIVKTSRGLFGRAKTFASYNHLDTNSASPGDVLMADPSPMPNHIAPMSIKGLGLSPRRNAAGQACNTTIGGLRKNMFSLAAEQRLRPAVGNESSFADEDILEDDDDVPDFGDSPSRPSSGLSGDSHNDPFSNITNGQQPVKRLPRPSLARQQTMPVNFHHQQPTAATQQRNKSNNLFGPRKTSPEKENRPPSSHQSNVPIVNSSPKRQPTTKDGRILTPSRKAPAPPSVAIGLAKLAQAHQFQSPVRVKGKTLLELQQDVVMLSPAKWDPMEYGEEMPSPFLARKGRAQR